MRRCTPSPMTVCSGRTEKIHSTSPTWTFTSSSGQSALLLRLNLLQLGCGLPGRACLL